MSNANLRQRLREPQPLLATFSIINSIEVVEMIALGGFEAVILDLEHGPYTIDSLGPLILAARAHEIFPIVRVQTNSPPQIGAALDAGAAGVLVPQVGSRAEAEAAVAAARYAPEGSRGAHPWVRASEFGHRAGWFGTANNEAAVITMIEGLSGAAAAADIVAAPGLDGVFIGPVDLSHSLGVPGQTEHPNVIAKIEEIMAKAQALQVATAVFSPTIERSLSWIAKGVKLVAAGADTAHILSAFTAVTQALNASRSSL